MAPQHLRRELRTLGAWFRIHNAFRHSAWSPREVCSCRAAKIEAQLKLPFARYFNAFQSAPRGRRFEVVRKLWSDLARSLPNVTGECVDIGEFRSFEEFETRYATVAGLLGRVEKIPPPGEIEFLIDSVLLERKWLANFDGVN
jgi:hypothetical protein